MLARNGIGRTNLETHKHKKLMLREAALPRLKYTVVCGRVITIADLPEPKNVRWVKSRKLIVVAAVQAGLLSIEDACARYELSREEFLSWQRVFVLERPSRSEAGTPKALKQYGGVRT